MRQPGIPHNSCIDKGSKGCHCTRKKWHMKPQNQPVASVCVSILILIKIFSFSFVKGSDFVEPSSTIKQTENPDYIFPIHRAFKCSRFPNERNWLKVFFGMGQQRTQTPGSSPNVGGFYSS